MSKFWSVASLVVVGTIIADILIHPTGTNVATNGIIGMQNSATNGLLGVSPTGGVSAGG